MRRKNDEYRKLYASCYRQYSLSVPFAERIFKLAIRGSLQGVGAGYTGQITANSFMKREFGKKLIEEYFAYQVEPDPRHRHVRCLHPRSRHPHGDPLRSHALPAPWLHHPRGPGYPWRARPARRTRRGLGVAGDRHQVDQPGSESEWVSAADAPPRPVRQASLEPQRWRCG